VLQGTTTSSYCIFLFLSFKQLLYGRKNTRLATAMSRMVVMGTPMRASPPLPEAAPAPPLGLTGTPVEVRAKKITTKDMVLTFN
jgi:hypothetical protein